MKTEIMLSKILNKNIKEINKENSRKEYVCFLYEEYSDENYYLIPSSIPYWEILDKFKKYTGLDELFVNNKKEIIAKKDNNEKNLGKFDSAIELLNLLKDFAEKNFSIIFM